MVKKEAPTKARNTGKLILEILIEVLDLTMSNPHNFMDYLTLGRQIVRGFLFLIVRLILGRSGMEVFNKEINSFFSSLIGYIVIGTFLIMMGLLMWVFPQYSILDNNYATLDTLFAVSPMVFMFLIPAVTMRTFAEEKQSGTIELLVTRPITDWQIVGGKFFACFTLVGFALLPTVLYYLSVHYLGAPRGNIDSGGTLGSYIGLLFLAGAFVAIGVFASSLTNNQIVAFVLATFLSFFVYLAFGFLSRLPIFFGKTDDIVQSLGIEYHYNSISRGALDTRDLVYFISVIVLFLAATVLSLGKRRW